VGVPGLWSTKKILEQISILYENESDGSRDAIKYCTNKKTNEGISDRKHCITGSTCSRRIKKDLSPTGDES
jgi:hypothetical protein